METKYKAVFGSLIGIILILFFMWATKGCGKQKPTTQDVISSYTDSIQRLKASNGDNIARIRVIEGERTKDFLKLKSQDSTIQSLQLTVQHYKKKLEHGGSVTNASTTTDVSGTTHTTVKWDTVHDSIFPAYNFSFKDKWTELSGVSKRDSTSFKLTVQNNYTVAIGKEKNGTPFAEVTTDNPYTKVNTLRTYQVTIPKERPKRFGLGIQGGYGLYGNGRGPYIGVGINYSIIRF